MSARSLRHAGITEGRGILRVALSDFHELGYITNYSTSYRVSPSTNVVSIAGREYSCFATLSGGKFHDAGTLAITTNEVYIWLDAHAAPKLIESDYKPPYFPPGF